MRNLLSLIIVSLMACAFCESAEVMHPINIIPRPDRIELSKGFFEVTPETTILVSKDAENIARYTRDLLEPATGYSLPIKRISQDQAKSNAIFLTITGADKSIGAEGYKLTVSPDSLAIQASEQAGLFYGIQTLRQLLPFQIESRERVSDTKWIIPSVTITDSPRFKWRGMHLDVGRHMFSVEFIKKYIDLMAMHKMNVFHWHLTEDQGWRIQIKKYPKLTEIGSKRSATPIPSNRNRLDGTPYGGFYTQEEIAGIVAYAAERYINVVPEIELPGHSVAALAAYPKLGCTGGPYKVRRKWGVAHDVYCAGNEAVYAFLEDVLTEVLELFPGKYIHIGGDECPKTRWKTCPECQSMIEAQGLKNEHELQSYFIERVGKFLTRNDRRLIGWDEILEGGLAPNATVMSWRGVKGGIKAAGMGHDVVMTPTSHCYFDYYQSQDKAGEPPAIGGFLPLKKVYSFNPIPPELTPDRIGHILGAQGNVWTEYMPNSKQVEYMAFPRACALAEVLWSGPGSQNYDDFLGRLDPLLQRLKLLEVNFREPKRDIHTLQQKNSPDEK